MRLDEITASNQADTDPALRNWLLKLHKGAVAGFNSKTVARLLGLFPGWTMKKMSFIKPSDEDREFTNRTAVAMPPYISQWNNHPVAQRATLLAHSRVDPSNPTRLEVTTHDAAEAQALHAEVSKFVVAKLPAPEAAKTTDFFVMNLTAPVHHTDPKDGNRWLWSFDLYRKCQGIRITAPDGQYFDVCGPVQVLGYRGTQDFAAFFKWALAHTDLEAAVNAKLGLAKHVKASDRPRIPVGGQTIGTCAICLHEQVVQHGRMVKHGYERPGHGYLVGSCFGVAYPPYEISAEACTDYVPHLEDILAAYQRRLADLQSGKVQEFRQTRRNYRTNRDETTVVKLGERTFADILKSEISKTEQQIKFIATDIATMQNRIRDWKPGMVRHNEAPVAA